jgi:hypothetical protein
MDGMNMALDYSAGRYRHDGWRWFDDAFRFAVYVGGDWFADLIDRRRRSWSVGAVRPPQWISYFFSRV